jgi:hypothetical protein
VPFLSLTGIYLRMALVLLYIPAYYIYRGGINYNETSGIFPLIYFLLFFQNIVGAISALLVWRVKCNIKIKYFLRKKNHALIFWVLVILAVAYTIFYFLTFQEKIPLLQILSGNFLQAASSRAEMTHDFAADATIFSFYRPVTKDLLFILLGALILSKQIPRLLKAVFFIFLSVSLLAHLEKSYVFMLALMLFSLKNFHRSENRRAEIELSLAIIILLFAATYIFFSEDVYEAIQYLPYRLMLQTGYISEQLNIAASYGTLYFNGINMGFVGRIFGIQHIDISKLAWASAHMDMDAIGISGSSAGLAAADGYMIFSYLGLLLMPIVFVLHFLIDKILRREIIEGVDLRNIYPVDRSFYIYLISLYPIYLISSFFGFFAIPYIFQPGLLLAVVILIIMYAIVFRVVRPFSYKNFLK